MNPQRNALDLLVQYAAYHRDQRNILTHFVGVPMIVFAVHVFLARLHLTLGDQPLNGAWVAFTLAAAWYMSRRGPLMLGLAVSAAMALLVALAQVAAGGSTASWLGWGLGMFSIGWLIQFIGHYYEGRKPAFLDDMASLLVGPMFVTAEALFSLGWNRPLMAEIERRAGPTHLRDLAHPA